MSTAIITGIGSGIGRAVAIELSARQYYEKYALLGRNSEAIHYTMAEMRKNGAENISFYHADLSKPESLPDIIRRIEISEGGIKALYNIAGYTDPQSIFATTLESFELTYRVNVF